MMVMITLVTEVMVTFNGKNESWKSRLSSEIQLDSHGKGLLSFGSSNMGSFPLTTYKQTLR